MINWRPATTVELLTHSHLIGELTAWNPNWQGRVNDEDVMRAVLNKDILSAVLNEQTLFLYVVVPEWFDKTRWMLCEMVLCSLPTEGPRAGFRKTVAAIEELARDHGCHTIRVGTALPKNGEALARLYRRCGYVDSPTQLHKEI